jgi:hypothetical protein
MANSPMIRALRNHRYMNLLIVYSLSILNSLLIAIRRLLSAIEKLPPLRVFRSPKSFSGLASSSSSDC